MNTKEIQIYQTEDTNTIIATDGKNYITDLQLDRGNGFKYLTNYYGTICPYYIDLEHNEMIEDVVPEVCILIAKSNVDPETGSIKISLHKNKMTKISKQFFNL